MFFGSTLSITSATDGGIFAANSVVNLDADLNAGFSGLSLDNSTLNLNGGTFSGDLDIDNGSAF